MPYNSTRPIHDADAHIMETASWLADYADPQLRDRIAPPGYVNELRQVGDLVTDDIEALFAKLTERHRSDRYRAAEAAEIMSRKNFAATGSFLADDRPRALDLLGFETQLMFNTFHNSRLFAWEQTPDLDFAYGAARAHNRGMVEFCSVDGRLLPTCYVPLADFERTGAIANEAIEMGAAALLIPSGCPAGHSPSHIGLDPLWAAAQEAGLPVVFHVGGTGELIDPDYFRNGLPIPPDFHGGEENFRSVDYMGIPHPPMQTLATMIFDGVLERFPRLKIGVIEQGAIWLPSWMRQMESAVEAFGRHEERLQRLSLRPSEYVERQIRVTPYPTEDIGWVTEQVGPDILLFSSDYPHVEGGRRPIERFERSLGDVGETVKQRFYHDNFVDLMERALMLNTTDPIDGCMEDWRRHLRGELPGGLDAILHPDVVFLSPIVFTPQEGREITKLYLTAAGGTLGGDPDPGDGQHGGGFRYTKQILQGNHAMLEFETSMEGKYVNGVDIITCDDEGLITEFKVMIRPLQAVNLVHAQMKAMLERLSSQ